MALEDIQSPESGLNIGADIDATTDTLSTANALDLSGVDNSFDSFNGLNLIQLSDVDRGLKAESGDNINLSDQTTQAPPVDKPKKPVTSIAELKERQRRLELRSDLYNQNQQAIASQSFRPMQMYGAYEFDKYKSNVERFEAYGKETFREIGFNPILSPEEQEKHFNDNTHWWQDVRRMGGQFMALSGTAFMSNYHSISNFFNGDYITDPDAESDAAFSEANRIGMSSKGGFTGFATNLALNSAYSVGIAANVAAEEIAIWGAGLALTPETGGTSLVAAGGIQTAEATSIASKLSKLKTALNASFRGAELSKVSRGGYGMLKSLAKAEDAKTFYQNLKTFGTGVVEFANPLRQTTSTIKGIYKGEAAYRNISNLGKMSRGFGSFYRDVRENWATLSEAQMEGGGVRRERIDENIDLFMKKSGGVLPTGKDLDDIYLNAETAGRVDALGNIPLIFLTNRITFDKIFKFRGIGELIENFEESSMKGLNKKFMWDTTAKVFKERAKEGMLKGAWNTIKSPKRLLAGGGLWYIKENLSEGIQELGQEWLSGATKNYYGRMYTDGHVTNAKLLKSSIYDGLIDATTSKESWQSVKDNIFSVQGLNTFASGFLMGGLIGGGRYSLSTITNGIWSKVSQAYQKWDNPQAFEAYQKSKSDIEQKHLAIMNNLLSNPENFFSSSYETFYNQRTNAENMDVADQANDNAAFHDAKDKLTYDHVMGALQNGTYDMVLNGFNELAKLSDTELSDYFNTQDASKAREKLSEYKERAESIKKRYDFFKENAPNPFNPSNFKKGSEEQIDEFISHKAYNDAVKDAIFSQYSFDRSLERMDGIYNNLIKNAPLKKITETELAVVINPNTISAEVRLLKQEAELLQQSPEREDKKLAKDKLKKAEILEDYLMHYNNYNYAKNAKSKLNVDSTAEERDSFDNLILNHLNNLRKTYKNYLVNIANQKNDYLFNNAVDNSFDDILDHYQLRDDSETQMANVNYLTNPNNLIRHAQRIRASLRELYDDRENVYKEGLNNFFKMTEVNGLIDALGGINIIINPQELVEYVKTGKIPSTFIDIKSGKEISKNDARSLTIQGMLDLLKIKKQQVERVPEIVPEETTIQEEEITTKEEPEEKPKEISKDVKTKLEDAYEKFTEETGSDMSFDDFVATHPTAARIKSEAVTKEEVIEVKAPEIEVVTEPAPTAPVSDKKAELQKELDDLLKDQEERLKKVTLGIPIGGIEGVKIGSRFVSGYNADVANTVLDPNFDPNTAENDGDGYSVVSRIYAYGEMKDGKLSKRPSIEITTFGTKAEADAYIEKKKIKDAENKSKLGSNKRIDAIREQLATLEGTPTTSVSDVEARKADIERRRQEELEASKINNSLSEFELENTPELKTGSTSKRFKIKKDGKEIGIVSLNIDENGNVRIAYMEINKDNRRKGLAESFYKDLNKALQKNKQGVLHSDKVFLDELSEWERMKKKGELRKWILDGKELSKDEIDNLKKDINKVIELQESGRLVTEEAKDLQEVLPAQKMWEKLVKKGFAEKLEDGTYRFKYDAELTALEGTKPAEEKPLTSRQQIAQEKINSILDKVTSLRDSPDVNFNNGSKASEDLLNLVTTGEITSDEAEIAAKKKYEELLNNLKLSDFIKGDVVIFKDGRKGIVVDVTKDEINMKMFDNPGAVEKMDASKVINNVAGIKNTKQAIEDEATTPVVEVSKEDEDNMKKSQETTESLATDSKRASAAIEEGIKNATDQPSGFDDLLLGCD